MPEVAEPRMALARLRVTGTRALSGDRREHAMLDAAAGRAGRRLVEVTTPESTTVTVTLGWVEGSEPVAGGDSGVVRTEMPDELVLTFASALRACWPDPDDVPFPGHWASAEAVLGARAIMGTLSGSDGNDGRSAEFHRKGALRRLREAGCLVGDEQQVRLGPIVATWSEEQVNVLRAVYEQLPVAPEFPTISVAMDFPDSPVDEPECSVIGADGADAAAFEEESW